MFVNPRQSTTSKTLSQGSKTCSKNNRGNLKEMAGRKEVEDRKKRFPWSFFLSFFFFFISVAVSTETSTAGMIYLAHLVKMFIFQKYCRGYPFEYYIEWGKIKKISEAWKDFFFICFRQSINSKWLFVYFSIFDG